MNTEDDIRNSEFNLWDCYEEIKYTREFIYKNMFDLNNDEKIQENLKTVYEKIGVFLELKTTDERCVRVICALMKETRKIIIDFVPLKKMYQIDSNQDKISKIINDVGIATKHIKTIVSEILESLIEDKKKHLSQICSRYINLEKNTGVRIWSK